MKLRFRLLHADEANDALWYLVSASRAQPSVLRPVVLEYQENSQTLPDHWTPVSCFYFPPSPQPINDDSPLRRQTVSSLNTLIENDLKDLE